MCDAPLCFPFPSITGVCIIPRRTDSDSKQQEILAARRDPKKQQAYFQQVNQRREQASKNVKELFNLSQGGKQDPAIKWMELRKQGKIKERETYEQYGDTNRGIIIPQVPFGDAKYDNGERFDLRLPYVVINCLRSNTPTRLTPRFGRRTVRPTDAVTHTHTPIRTRATWTRRPRWATPSSGSSGSGRTASPRSSRRGPAAKGAPTGPRAKKSELTFMGGVASAFRGRRRGLRAESRGACNVVLV